MIMANNQAESTKNFASYTIPEGLDVQCNAHCRLCTVGLRRTKRHCSSQFREYVATRRQRMALYWYQNQVIAPSPLREFVATVL